MRWIALGRDGLGLRHVWLMRPVRVLRRAVSCKLTYCREQGSLANLLGLLSPFTFTLCCCSNLRDPCIMLDGGLRLLVSGEPPVPIDDIHSSWKGPKRVVDVIGFWRVAMEWVI